MNVYRYVSGSSFETIYPNSGTSADFAYSQGIPIVFTIELRGEKSSPSLFLLVSVLCESDNPNQLSSSSSACR
jgi:hypothetical protein